MVDYFKNAYEAHSHTETYESPSIGNKRKECQLFTLDVPCIVGIFDENVNNCQIFRGIVKQKLRYLWIRIDDINVWFVIGAASF